MPVVVSPRRFDTHLKVLWEQEVVVNAEHHHQLTQRLVESSQHGTCMSWAHQQALQTPFGCLLMILLGTLQPTSNSEYQYMTVLLWKTYATIYQETFKAANSLTDKSLELMSITRDDATVKPDIDPALALSGSDLLPQTGDSGRGWDSIKRHVNDSRDTAKGSSTNSTPT